MPGEDTLAPLTESVRSVGTSGSCRSDGSSRSSQRISGLQSHLLRTQSNRDPMDIYEVMEILGEGSMGSVSRVRKRLDAIGGSARREFVRKHGSKGCCFGWFNFIKLPSKRDSFLDSSRIATSTTTTVTSSNGSSGNKTAGRHLYRKQSSIVKHSEHHKAGVYALKSIHLDRCTTKEYIEELKVRLKMPWKESCCFLLSMSFT